MHRTTLASVALLALSACASRSFLEVASPTEDLRPGDSIVFEHPQGMGFESVALDLDAEVPVVVRASLENWNMDRALYDADGEWVKPAWARGDESMYDVEASGRYEFRFGLRGLLWTGQVPIELRAANDEDVALAERRREEAAKTAEWARKKAAEERAAREEAERVAAAERLGREAEMRKCACNGTGYEIVGLHQRYERGVPVTYEVTAVRQVHRHFRGHLRTFHEPEPCSRCNGANRVSDPPKVLLASEL